MDESATEALALQVGKAIAERTGVAVSEQAVATTMDLAEHYLGAGQLPGVVLELLKRAAGRSVNSGEKALTSASIVATLSQISGLPAVVLDTTQRVELARVREFFSSRVIGQDEAVKAVVDRIAMLKAGLIDPGRPIGVFLFAGPTGTGKTELAKTLAEFLFGAAERMVRLDMSELQTLEATSKIVGQRGDGGSDSLIDRVRKQPFSVILLDEFEKAHSNCWDLFLQIFDDGRLSDANGREADFRHCFIILTSNLGATAHRGSGLGFRPDPGTYADDQVLRTIAQTFRPEFINRLDKIIIFQPLSRDLMRGILHKELALVQARRGLRDRSWAVEWEASAIEFLLDRGFSPEMGARPLKRAIDQLLLAPLAATLVEHRFPEGEQFLFVRSNGKEIEVEFVDPDAEPPDDAAEADVDDSLSLPSIILRPTGSPAERAVLAVHWRDIGDELSGDGWRSTNDRLRMALADPAIWSRDDRFCIFSSLEMMDRVGEAARTGERLFKRFASTKDRSARASRELAGRLALQLFNLRKGLDDVAADAPIDALLRVEPALDSVGGADEIADWCTKLTDMYRRWADRRRMQLTEIRPRDGNGMPILHVTGFGAFRTLAAEIGLHVLEDPAQENARRIVARVVRVAGPEQELPAPGAFAAAADLLAAQPNSTTIIRRYRQAPSPMVRDIAHGWRTGRLDAVLGGDFDLLAAVKSRQPVP
jgi:ATP-dependent Clp protease ATP-binding subunit ClpC